MTLDIPAWSAEVVAGLDHPVVFATVSGTHLYGFASVDSDLDLRGAHLLPAADVVGLRTGPDTLQSAGRRGASNSTWSPTTCSRSPGC